MFRGRCCVLRMFVQFHQHMVGAVLLEFVYVGVDAAGQFGIVVLVDGNIVHIPASQFFGQNIEEDIVFVFDCGTSAE